MPASKYCAGQLRHTVSLQQPTTGTPDSYGEDLPAFSEVLSCRARIWPLSGSEQLNVDGTTQGQVTHEIAVRYASEVAAIGPSWRVVFGSRVFEILSVLNPLERNQWLVIMAREKV